MTPGERIKKIREALGLTQGAFGDTLGFKWYKVKDIEAGKIKVSPEIAIKIDKIYSYRYEWILTGMEPIKRGKERPAPPIGADHAALYEYKIKPADPVILEIIDILENDLPEMKPFVLKLLRGRKEVKEGLEGMGIGDIS